ncbi:MAG TPA: hypothetical protein VHP34_09140 [Alphaproteobacteria bacterium]|nr:hypothetical protein [Alphaproteobacteria bacterium]
MQKETVSQTNRVHSAKAMLAVLVLVFLTACSGMNKTEQRMLSGAAIGAGVGTVGTAMTGGCVSCGAAIGTAVGAGAGYVVDRYNK